jgi:hypothetical protein
MDLDFIPPTIEGHNMNTMTDNLSIQETKEWILSPLNRCDSCAAEALVHVKGLGGELMFCGHHYNKIIDSPVGYKKMMDFMYEVIDEREKLVENRLKGRD